MSSVDSRAVSARINNQIADRFTEIAESRGYTTAGLLSEFVYSVVNGKDEPEADDSELPEQTSRLYDVALSLVDDLADAGYPESEIVSAFTGIRRELL